MSPDSHMKLKPNPYSVPLKLDQISWPQNKRLLGNVNFVYILRQIATRETHMVNLKQSVIATRNTGDELRAKMTEAKSNLDRKTKEIKSMESR